MSRTQNWFDRLYERHAGAIRAYCHRRTASADADDAAAEVFTVAWRRRDEIPGGGRELPWLYGVARRVLSQQRRSSARYERLTHRIRSVRQPAAPLPETVVVQRTEYRQVREAVERLREPDREILLLSAWEGLSHSEMAEALGCSLAAVDKRLTRAKQRLARHYESTHATRSHRPPASATGGGGS
ncbi:MAG: sigma-70 family RNA polymerase sigma factor [Acidimicrobiia bacterium]|nr:sigma-70 family RNA polymerase sigma factor [Acidimicrobiia bacterium]NNF09456.1 sigma-70 family RNA polymerase sigma factor [Acidimicrobiia bacterium]NNL71676.1 sigma-70 family RNA polymerase sigma factor [Acidimicrobiia bacterium]